MSLRIPRPWVYTPFGHDSCERLGGLAGDSYTSDYCTWFCETLYDCYYATMDWKNRCFLFETCDVTMEKGNCQLWERTSTPTLPPKNPTEGYTLQNTGKKCDKTLGAVVASKSSLGGGGHDIEACAKGCDGVRDCNWFHYTASGFCNLFMDCPEQARVDFDAVVYSRDNYQLQSRIERCDKFAPGQAPVSLGGMGWTQEECIAGCDEDKHCGWYVWYAIKGYCHKFYKCDVLDEAKGGSLWYSRVNEAPVPFFHWWDIISEFDRCDPADAANVRATRFRYIDLNELAHLFPLSFFCLRRCSHPRTL